MDEILRQFVVVVRASWMHRRLGVVVAWMVGVVGAAVVLQIPDKYEATARVYVDTQSILKPLMAGLAIQPNVEQQISMLSRTLITRPNIEKLIRMADLDLQSQSKQQQEALVDHLLKTLTIKSTARDNLYSVEYRNEQPERAKKVVQSLVSIFVESSLGDKRKDSDSAKRFIDDQIKGYEKKLEEAETKLKDFKVRNLEMRLGDPRSTSERLAELTERAGAARLELKEAMNSRDALKRQLVGEEPVLVPDAPITDSAVSVPEIDGRLETMKRNLDALLQKYTDQHPDVLGARRTIKELEDQKRTEIQARRAAVSARPASTSGNNPVYQQLRVSLGEAEATVSSLQARVAEYESRLARAKSELKLSPQIEAEFAQLNRDYEINKKNYEQLVSRRESANISGELESSSAVAEFRLIDPPRVGTKPVAPNRILLLSISLMISLLAGCAAAFVFSQIRPVFLDSRSLRDATGLPILGAVSLVVNEELRVRERRSLLRVFAALGTLVAIYGAGISSLIYLAARA